MRIVNLSNYFNHHQKSLADAMYAILGDDYHFIETTGVPEFRKELGYQEITAPYVLKYNGETKATIDQMVMDADVVIYGEAPLSMVKARYNAGKLTFRDDESRYKNPNRYLKWPVYTYNSHWINKGYLLCDSAYGPIDYMLSGMNPKKCFRWGYFTEVKKYESAEALMAKKRANAGQGISILWAGRLIGWKHPEAAVYVAKRLKRDGIEFNMNIIGTGKIEEKIRKMVQKENLNEHVQLLGPMPPEKVRKHMEESDIFLFTSDRCEGWGAVLNESMNSGCAVVSDENIGSTKYLIDHQRNGIIYKSQDWKDLYVKVKWLVEHPSEMKDMCKEAYFTMLNQWNGENSAKNFIALSEALLNGEKQTPVTEGPCSLAPLIMRRWKGRFSTF